MKLKRAYNRLVMRVDAYLKQRREAGHWERHLPAAIFDTHLWLWERRSLQVGAAWGAAMALAPLPLQSYFALLCCLWRKGNVPVGVLACWISIPGYQVIAWPLQWALGAWVLGLMGVPTSGASMAFIKDLALSVPDGWSAVEALLMQVNYWGVMGEFALGCLLSCSLIALLFYLLVGLLVSDETTC